MELEFSIINYIESQRNLLGRLDIPSIQAAIEVISDSFLAGRKVITCGNGGSAATASHYITDWSKMVNIYTGKKFRGFSLCDNIGLITAFGNDLAYEDVFSGQLNSILDPGDLLVAISGSGNSPNVVKAVRYANENNAKTLAILGYDGGILKSIAQQHVLVPSFDMQLCEDIHLLFGHIVMKALCGSNIKLQTK